MIDHGGKNVFFIINLQGKQDLLPHKSAHFGPLASYSGPWADASFIFILFSPISKLHSLLKIILG
jgi:hypothetical protein